MSTSWLKQHGYRIAPLLLLLAVAALLLLLLLWRRQLLQVQLLKDQLTAAEGPAALRILFSHRLTRFHNRRRENTIRKGPRFDRQTRHDSKHQWQQQPYIRRELCSS